jgi:hypothetical protein
MSRSAKGNPENMSVISSAEVRHLVGSVTDDTISAILKTEPSREDLEVAASCLSSEGSDMDRLGHSMTGGTAL